MYTPYPLKNPKKPRVFALSGCAFYQRIVNRFPLCLQWFMPFSTVQF